MSGLALLLLQLVVVLVAAHLGGALAARVGQPRVVGEMAAGIALGPTLLGALAPNAAAVVFPADGLEALGAVAQLGIVLYLFVVGLRLDLGVLRSRARLAVMVS